MSSIFSVPQLIARFHPDTGVLGEEPILQRHLADLKGCFENAEAFEEMLSRGNKLVYTVSAMQPADAEGDLHCGLGVIYPGLVGNEYFLTKGHLHSWRAAAEIYIGIAGEGIMLLEDENTSESRAVPLERNSLVYVPGNTAHRTVNTGNVPLAYLGVYPAVAGHDYGALAKRNFRSVVVEYQGKPRVLPRK